MRKIILTAIAAVLSSWAYCNNVALSNVSIVNNGPDSIQVQFDLSWENSWRTNIGTNNYDGVYVFFKYRTPGGNWQPMYFSYLDNVLPSGAEVRSFGNISPVHLQGQVVYQYANGVSNVSFTGIKLGVDAALPYNIEVKGFAIEVVYIPPAPQIDNAFFIGDGDGTSESANALHPQPSDNTGIAVPGTTSLVRTVAVDVNSFDDAALEAGVPISHNRISTNTNFPTGSGYWCMKYELSQAAYHDFLNTLTVAQQTTRTANPPTSATGTSALTTAPGVGRMYIEIAVPASGSTPAVYGCDYTNNNIYDEPGDGEYVACNFLSWGDVAAYLDWCGMAPLTEIVYERICRGHANAAANAAVTGKYAWGTTTINAAVLGVTSPGAANALISGASTTAGNANYSGSGLASLHRTGVFATATSNRITSGSSFFGVMDMRGNLGEPCITIGNVAGRSFVRSWGDGILSTIGNATDIPWPHNQYKHRHQLLFRL